MSKITINLIHINFPYFWRSYFMKFIFKTLQVFAFLSVVCVVVYAVGPKPEKLELSALAQPIMDPTDFNSNYVAEAVAAAEQELDIREGNESILHWADSVGKKTNYVLLYLHGFSASPVEGDPIHLDFAKRYGMNMYAPLLADHGLVEQEPMLHFTAERYVESAKQALRIARLMGDSVIVMSTSTGSTAALFLASGKNDIHSLICYSPNIEIFDPKSSLLAGPWGIEIARKVKGGNYHQWEAPAGAEQYWHLKYRLESLVELQRLVEGTMVESTFRKIEVPVFLGYYYKNEEEQDDVVSVAAALRMFDQLGSAQKRKVAFPKVGVHALASRYFSEDLEIVRQSTYAFAESDLGIRPAQ